MRIIWKIVLLLALASPTFAQDTYATESLEDRKISITVSPIHLILPVIELTGEYAINPRLSVAVIGGVGSIPLKLSNGQEETLQAFEVGGQVRFYALGDFGHGMQVGAELLHLNIDGDISDIELKGIGTAAGVFIGYKIATEVGFTFDAQVGPSYVFGKAKAERGRQMEEQEDSSIIPLLNLNVGWSF